MIENIPESLKDKLKDVDLSKLEQCILDAREMAKEDLTGNTMLRERIPLLIKMVRQVKTEVARTSIECRPERFDVDRAEWYEPFEDIQKALDYAEYQIRTKLREHLGASVFGEPSYQELLKRFKDFKERKEK